jgi:hypothetical protein
LERVGDHPVPAGPLAVRWLGLAVPRVRAGEPTVARVLLENAGTAPWRSRGLEGVQLSSHWLDDLGNPIVWDGERAAFPRDIEPGDSVEMRLRLTGPRPPGPYRLALDLLEEHRFWFAEVGSYVLEVPVDVAERIEHRRLSVVVHGGAHAATTAALAAQEDAVVEAAPAAVAHLVAGAVPAPDWSRRLLDAHAEGWPAVGPRLDVGWARAERRRFARWSTPGRNPGLGAPLLLPSLLAGLEPGEHEGLPAWDGPDALYDGRIRVRLRLRSGRRRG